MRMFIMVLLVSLLGILMFGTANAADGKEVYDFYCAQCHGVDGKGDGPNVTEDFATDPRNFTVQAEMEKLTDADIRNVVLDGGPALSKSELMPPWSKTLSTEEVESLVTHLRELCGCQHKPGA